MLKLINQRSTYIDSLVGDLTARKKRQEKLKFLPFLNRLGASLNPPKTWKSVEVLPVSSQQGAGCILPVSMSLLVDGCRASLLVRSMKKRSMDRSFDWSKWKSQWKASAETVECDSGEISFLYIKYCIPHLNKILMIYKYLKKWYTTWTHHVIYFLKCTWFVFWRSVHIFPYLYMYDAKCIWYT